MMPASAPGLLAPLDQKALERAFALLENPDFAARLAEYAGQPVRRAMRVMPRPASDRLNRAAEAAIMKCLELATRSIRPASRRKPTMLLSSVLAGISGGVGGAFGIAALPVELPLTTTLMLRAIAAIARHHGEDLSTLEARLACVEVFALGARKSETGTCIGYYATRALLSRLAGEASAFLLERGMSSASAPVVTGVVAEIATRFGVVVSERAAAGALPAIGALGGAVVNVAFMNHFQRLARGHFLMRRLERRYGIAAVRRGYEALASRASDAA